MTHLKKYVSAALMMCCFTTIFAQVNLEWVKKYADPNNNQAYGYFNALAVDNNGDVCVAGETYNNSGNNIIVEKYSSSGSTLWSTTFSINNSTYEYVRGGVGVDANNNIYVSGFTYNNNNNNYNNYYDLFVVKFDANGNLLWTQIYDSGYNDYMDFSGIIVESNGNVILAGSRYNNNNSNNYYDLVFVKYDAGGNILWNTIVDNGYYEYLRSIDSDANGNIYASFQSYNFNNNGYNSIGAVKLNSSGVQQWYQLYNPSSTTQVYNYVNSIDVNQNEEVFITGYQYNNTNSNNYYDFLTIKYDNNGTQQWANLFDGGSYDYYGPVAADNNGNVIATSNSYDINSNSYYWNVIKYDGSGNQLWVTPVFQDSSGNYAWNYDMAIDAAGNVYPTGIGYSNNNYNYYAAKTARVNADGSIGWTENYLDSNANSNYYYAYGFEVDVDNGGNVYVFGTEYNYSGNYISQILTIKYSQVELPAFTASVNDESCIGSSDGSITLNITAGELPPFEHSIDNGFTYSLNNTFTGLSPGTYYAMVRDSLGNTTPVQQVIVGTVTDTILPSITCGGDITITATPDDCNPSVTWEAPIASDNCTFNVSSSHASGDNFPIGTTTVYYTVTDTAGNTASCSFNITVNPNPLTGEVQANTYIGGYNVSCNGSTDGAATANADGGCLPYSYSWNTNPVQTMATASNLGAGTYTVTVTDANGQVLTLMVTLTEPPILTADAGANATVYYGYIPSSCANLAGTANGGVPSYNYSWSNGANTAATQVCPSSTTIYTLTVTDANGCVASDDVAICVVDVRCEKGGNAIVKGQGDKVMVCHYSGNGNSQTLCIAADAVAAHLAHGDQLGECGTDLSCFESGKKESEIIVTNEIQTSDNLAAFPNPFTNTTTLVFSANGSERTVVEILDLKGSLMKTLFDENTIEGQVYRIDIDGSSWNDAIYIARIVNNNQVQNLKLVLTK